MKKVGENQIVENIKNLKYECKFKSIDDLRIAYGINIEQFLVKALKKVMKSSRKVYDYRVVCKEVV